MIKFFFFFFFFFCSICLAVLETAEARRGGGGRGRGGTRGRGRGSGGGGGGYTKPKNYNNVALSGRILKGSSRYNKNTWRKAAAAGLIFGGAMYLARPRHHHLYNQSRLLDVQFHNFYDLFSFLIVVFVLCV